MAQELASRAALARENSRLYAASQRAVALRDDFIAVASHELRTPVTSLKVHTEVLLRQGDLGRRSDSLLISPLRAMNSQIDRLSGLIVDLLDVARIEAGTLAMRREATDLRQLVEEIVEEMQTTTTKHRIKVEGSTALYFFGDRERFGAVEPSVDFGQHLGFQRRVASQGQPARRGERATDVAGRCVGSDSLLRNVAAPAVVRSG